MNKNYIDTETTTSICRCCSCPVVGRMYYRYHRTRKGYYPVCLLCMDRPYRIHARFKKEPATHRKYVEHLLRCKLVEESI